MHMHLIMRDARSRQVLSLHCDPELHRSDEHYLYRRGPHLHVEGADPSVDRAHISLCLLDAELGGGNIVRLTNSLTAAVRMIARELVPCCVGGGLGLPKGKLFQATDPLSITEPCEETALHAF